jgi:hypothetical protein
VHNKYNVEWSNRPINFLSTETLEDIFKATQETFCVIYIRHKHKSNYRGFSWDHNTNLEDFDDEAVVRKYAHVHDFDDIYKQHSATYDVNAFKNVLCSRCYYFVSSQGGGIYHSSYFSGAAISILHRQGMEMRAADTDGLYRMTSNPHPQLLICLTEDDILASVEAMIRSHVLSGGVMFSKQAADIVERLAATNQRTRYYIQESERRALLEAASAAESRD